MVWFIIHIYNHVANMYSLPLGILLHSEVRKPRTRRRRRDAYIAL